MDVAHPARSVAPTLDMVVLEVLSRTTAALTLAQIHRLAGTGSVSGLLKALARLVESGLVLVQPGGYGLNREHVAAAAVEALAAMRSELIERIRSQVAAWRPAPLFVGIFGSFARRDGDAKSDIDLLVLWRAPGEHPAHQAGELAGAIRRWSGNEAHVVEVTPDDLTRMAVDSEPILDSWRADLIPVFGRLHLPALGHDSRPTVRAHTGE